MATGKEYEFGTVLVKKPANRQHCLIDCDGSFLRELVFLAPLFHARAAACLGSACAACAATQVDPPRAGLDDTTLELVARYPAVLYISCNPFVSLRRDLNALLRPRRPGGGGGGFVLRKVALIDHFPYTPHTELAVYLSKESEEPMAAPKEVGL